MTPILLGIPLAAVLALILLSVGVRPARVVVVWTAIVLVVGATTLFVGPSEEDTPPPAAEKVAHPAAERV